MEIGKNVYRILARGISTDLVGENDFIIKG